MSLLRNGSAEADQAEAAPNPAKEHTHLNGTTHVNGTTLHNAKAHNGTTVHHTPHAADDDASAPSSRVAVKEAKEARSP